MFVFIVKMKAEYDGEYVGFGDTIEDAVNDAESNSGDTLELISVYRAEEIKVKKVTEYRILN